MAYFRIDFIGDVRPPRYVKHDNGSQCLYAEIDELIGLVPHPLNDIPYALEIDGWGDDQACIGDVYETDAGLTVTCISEEEFREDTGQRDVPTRLLEKFM
ncbi:MAG: hypothetical protein IJ904_07705 [Candidatus Methanomethylophilaceae archaeon]|nr:hypothetical protein [Candidatus Methanomethylophilaceae archaeon]